MSSFDSKRIFNHKFCLVLTWSSSSSSFDKQSQRVAEEKWCDDGNKKKKMKKNEGEKIKKVEKEREKNRENR